MRVTDCQQLLREWPREAVLRDEVCAAQCGFLLRGSVSGSITSDLNPPPLRNVRADRPQQRFPTRGFEGFEGFKFPDLTPYITK